MVGSQLVGLVPLKALLDAAAFYCKKENLFILEEEHRIRLVGCAPARAAGGGGGSKLGALGAGLGAGARAARALLLLCCCCIPWA